jgi:acylpyruvate hydrolase
MQLVSYWLGKELRAGAVEAGQLVDAAKAGKYPSSLRAILANGQVDQFITDARSLIGSSDTVDVSTVRLGPPIPNPDKILCLGLNYSDHAAEAQMELPKAPIVFPKFINSLIGPFDDVVVPRAASAKVDYEIELAVIIGQRAR